MSIFQKLKHTIRYNTILVPYNTISCFHVFRYINHVFFRIHFQTDLAKLMQYNAILYFYDTIQYNIFPMLFAILTVFFASISRPARHQGHVHHPEVERAARIGAKGRGQQAPPRGRDPQGAAPRENTHAAPPQRATHRHPQQVQTVQPGGGVPRAAQGVVFHGRTDRRGGVIVTCRPTFFFCYYYRVFLLRKSDAFLRSGRLCHNSYQVFLQEFKKRRRFFQ